MHESVKLKIVYPHHLRFMKQKAHEILVIRTCHALASRGHQVHLLIGRSGKTTEEILEYYGLAPYKNLHIYQLPILRMEGNIRFSWNSVFNFFCYRKILNLKSKIVPDYLYLSELKLAKYLQDSNVQIPIAYEIHGLYAPNYENMDPIERRVFVNSEFLITTTESLKTRIRKLYPDAPEIYKVPLATDIDSQSSHHLRHVSNAEYRVVYVGDIYPLQGIETAIKALVKLPKWVTLDIVGGRKKEEKYNLRKLAVSMGLEKRVRIRGFVEPRDIRSWLYRADVLIAPCLAKKKMPYVAHTKIYEYLSAGKPIIASNLPAIREVLEDGKNSLLFKAGDPNDLARCVQQLISEPELSKQIGSHAYETAKRFTWELRAERLENSFLNHTMNRNVRSINLNP